MVIEHAKNATLELLHHKNTCSYGAKIRILMA